MQQTIYDNKTNQSIEPSETFMMEFSYENT